MGTLKYNEMPLKTNSMLLYFLCSGNFNFCLFQCPFSVFSVLILLSIKKGNLFSRVVFSVSLEYISFESTFHGFSGGFCALSVVLKIFSVIFSIKVSQCLQCLTCYTVIDNTPKAHICVIGVVHDPCCELKQCFSGFIKF